MHTPTHRCTGHARALFCSLARSPTHTQTHTNTGLRHVCTCVVLARQSNRELYLDASLSLCASFILDLLTGRGGGSSHGGSGIDASVAAGAFESPLKLTQEQEWKDSCELVPEEEMYGFVLRAHPWTNWHPVIEGTCNLTAFESRPRIAITSIYAVKPASMSDKAYIAEKTSFYAKLLHQQEVFEHARECMRTLRSRGRKLPAQGHRRADQAVVSNATDESSRPKSARTRAGGHLRERVAAHSLLGDAALRSGLVEAQTELPVGGKVLGVHVRYTDNLVDSNKVQNGLVTALDDFVQAIEHALVVLGAQGCAEGHRGGVRVLLCTDNHAVRSYMRERGVACVGPPMVSRDRYSQALFEMLLLASSDLIIGRYVRA